ncbi:MAG: DUF4160 domain-containing protein [Lachnospiraceae bacterium]|nr:DUF4160 domain-containing protein [Lachnospiraceae bacterium]
MRFHIYFRSNEGDPIEPIHFHISEEPHKNAMKYWILSDGSVAKAKEKWRERKERLRNNVINATIKR